MEIVQNGIDMKYSKEILWHFTCYDCKGWWSIAASDSIIDDAWHPNNSKNLYCPHCGRNQGLPTLKALIDEDKII